MKQGVHDTIGHGYAEARRADPRIAARVLEALGDARTVVNVGAGTGNYEPRDRFVVAVEPSLVMIRQRWSGHVVRAVAEDLPFADDAFDAALAVNTVGHWRDRARGLRELRRVSSRRVVLFQYLSGTADPFWLDADYFPEEAASAEVAELTRSEVEEILGPVEVHEVPIPHDCSDGFLGSHWRDPAAYLDEVVWRRMSPLALLPDAVRRRGLTRLEEDLRSGAWLARHADLLDREELDVGFRLIIARGEDEHL